MFFSLSSYISPGFLSLLLLVLVNSAQSASSSSKLNCNKSVRDTPSLSSERRYYEAVVGSDILLSCQVCRYKHHAVTVSWMKNNIPISQSSRVHSVHTHRLGTDIFSLRIRSLNPRDLGNYSCNLNMDGSNKELDSVSMVVDKLPPPPVFLSRTDRVNETSQLLTWTGESQMPIIHFLMEFRLKPLAGSGEDWVSLVIPFNPNSPVQSYLLQGLTTGTSYEVRIRSKTRHGVSHYSHTWVFSTWSPWTTTKPVTVFSLPQIVHQDPPQSVLDQPHQNNQWQPFNNYHSADSQHNSLAKELSSFSGGTGVTRALGLVTVVSLVITLF